MNVTNIRDVSHKVNGQIGASHIGEEGIGAFVYILSAEGGEVSLSDLASALALVGSGSLPPDAPSSVVRTARAASKVAKDHGFSCVSRRKVQGAKRGTDGWELVRGSHVDLNDPSGTLGARVSPIVATAREGSFDGEQGIVDELKSAYRAAEDLLTGDDLSSWFTSNVASLNGIGIKGGVYYLPPESAARFAKLTNAVQVASGGRYEVHAAPMASAEGSLRVVLSALVHDTASAVDEVQRTIEEGRGARALETREDVCRGLLTRLERYAGLLGPKLDEIKASVQAAQASVAAAMLASAAE